MTIQNKIQNLIKLRSKIEEAEAKLSPLKDEKNSLQADIIKSLKKQGFASIKTKEATVSIKKSRRLVVNNEAELVADLKSRKLNDMVCESVNKDLWGSFSREAIKQDIQLKGTSIAESEYISVLKPKTK